MKEKIKKIVTEFVKLTLLGVIAGLIGFVCLLVVSTHVNVKALETSHCAELAAENVTFSAELDRVNQVVGSCLTSLGDVSTKLMVCQIQAEGLRELGSGHALDTPTSAGEIARCRKVLEPVSEACCDSDCFRPEEDGSWMDEDHDRDVLPVGPEDDWCNGSGCGELDANP
jgi:hypothetical protein